MSSGSNKFGDLFQWTTFGESHGSAMGVVIDGCPSGVIFDEALLVENLKARRPGEGLGVSNRKEDDVPEILSGVLENKTLGTPIAVVVRNTNQNSSDYDSLKQAPRVGHADDVWQGKFQHWDHRGGGRSSARETLNWVIAGSFAQMFLKQVQPEMDVSAKLVEVGGEKIEDPENLITKLEKAKSEGESFGAVIEAKVSQPPQFLGEPIFKKTKSELARAYMSINACVGVEFGGGFAMTSLKGTEVHQQSDAVIYGGLRGGLTTGEEVSFRLAFKPTASILDVAKKGRHDPCVAVRAVPIVKAITWAVMADLFLARKINQV